MEEILGSIYCNNSELFGTRLMKNMFKTIKEEKHDLGVVMKEKKIGNLYGFSSGNYAGNVYEKKQFVSNNQYVPRRWKATNDY